MNRKISSPSRSSFDESLMRPPPITNCIFCGAPNVTKEHVYSRWTHKYLPPRENAKATSASGRQYLDRSDTIITKMPGQMRDWQVKCVCGGTHLSCNGGWMRKIEDLAKPVMKPLIVGEAIRLFPKDQKIIATWAVLKVIIAEYDNRNPITIHHMQRKYLMKRQSPPNKGWGVWIGTFERVNWKPEWVSRPVLLLPTHIVAKRTSREATYFNSNATTQVIGKLFIHVIHSPMPRLIEAWRFPKPHKGALFRIWPPASNSIKWPGSKLSDLDADNIADGLFSFLMEIQRRRSSGVSV